MEVSMLKCLVLLCSMGSALITLAPARAPAQNNPRSMQDTLKKVNAAKRESSATSIRTTDSTKQLQYYAKEGFTLAVIFPYHTIGGDFDGESVLYSNQDVFSLPTVTGNYGWGVMAGYRFTKGALELTYLTSTHDVMFLKANGKAHYNVINFDLKFCFQAEKPIQPYCLAGIGIPWLIVNEGHVTVHPGGTTSNADDAMFASAIAFNLGGGLYLHLHPAFSLGAEVSYRVIIFGTVNGITIGKDVTLMGNGLALSVRAAITL